MTDIPDIKNVVKITYTYHFPDGKKKEFYLEGQAVLDFFLQINEASAVSFFHGSRFQQLNWKEKIIT